MNALKYLKGKNIGVLFGGQSAERDISLLTGQAVINALKALGLITIPIDAGPDLPLKLKKHAIDFVFIALHGPGGEDGTVQGLLEVMEIPYTGCGVLASALAMDKIAAKIVFDSLKIPTPSWQVVENMKVLPQAKHYPVVIKPATQGSALGVSIVNNKKELAKALKMAFSLDSRVLMEQYIKGTEITVGILGETALPVIEIVPKGRFYDFKSKYKPGQAKHLIPPRLQSGVIKEAQSIALKAFKALGCRAVSRIDLIVDKEQQPWVLEINTIPGMTETSLLPDAARAAGLSFNNLVLKIVEYSLGN